MVRLEPVSPIQTDVLSIVLQTSDFLILLCFREINFSNNKHIVTTYRKLRAFQALKVLRVYLHGPDKEMGTETFNYLPKVTQRRRCVLQGFQCLGVNLARESKYPTSCKCAKCNQSSKKRGMK